MQYGRVTILAVFVVVVVAAGAAVGTTILVPSEQPTIQQGIDAAVAGDVVQVAAGTYTGVLNRDLDFGGVSITLESESGAGATVIDCESAGRGFFFHSGEDTTSVIRGFTISSAVADSGAGAYCISGSSPRFEECTFTDCVAVLRGGGLCCDASSPVARDCEFVQNMVTGSGRSSGYGGGMSCLSGSAPLITGTEFRYNYPSRAAVGCSRGIPLCRWASACSWRTRARRMRPGAERGLSIPMGPRSPTASSGRTVSTTEWGADCTAPAPTSQLRIVYSSTTSPEQPAGSISPRRPRPRSPGVRSSGIPARGAQRVRSSVTPKRLRLSAIARSWPTASIRSGP